MIGTPSLSDDGAELVERMEQSFSCKEVAEWQVADSTTSNDPSKDIDVHSCL